MAYLVHGYLWILVRFLLLLLSRPDCSQYLERNSFGWNDVADFMTVQFLHHVNAKVNPEPDYIFML